MESEGTAGRDAQVEEVFLTDPLDPDMPPTAREHIRAAQEAELRGDRTEAVEFLLRAVDEFESAQHYGRAIQMLRHALRLDPARTELESDIVRLEVCLAEPPRTLSLESNALEEAAQEALASLEAFEAQVRVDDNAEELPSEVAERLRVRAARTVDPRKPRTVNLRAWLSEDAAEASPGAERKSEPAAEPTPVTASQTNASSIAGTSTSAEASFNSSSELNAERAEDVQDEALIPSLDPSAVSSRGPVLAGEGEAWCSFCCRPNAETGHLISGPTGSFICATCIAESARTLEVPVGSEPAKPIQVLDTALLGQDAARFAVEQGLQQPGAFVLLLGPAGTGKSHLLRTLALRSASNGHTHPVLLDENAPGVGWEAKLRNALVSTPDRPLVLALRGGPLPSFHTLRASDGEAALFSTAALVKATGGKLSVELAERVTTVAPFVSLGEETLEQVASQWLAENPRVSIGAATLKALVKESANSGRGAHELHALLRRIPAGHWTPPPAIKPGKVTAKKPASKPVAKGNVKKRR